MPEGMKHYDSKDAAKKKFHAIVDRSEAFVNYELEYAVMDDEGADTGVAHMLLTLEGHFDRDVIEILTRVGGIAIKTVGEALNKF